MATDNKYDRQLRLWGSDGQFRLSSAKICVIGSSGLASETLKNLVLPGIGFFTIIDDAIISESDLGNNFFLTANFLNQPRAEVVKNFLLELNPDVKGESLQKSFEEILTLPEFFKQFDLVIATQLNFDDILRLALICEEGNVKLIVARSVGLIGYLRVYCEENLVVESKPSDKELIDLRVHKPFEELEKFCAGVDLDGIEDLYHSHVPFVVILVKLMKEWVAVHGHRPKSFEEKQDFKQMIKGKSRNFVMETNFNEAAEKAYLACLTEDLSEEILAVLQDSKSLTADDTSLEFWKCAKAVNQFCVVKGVPPLTGLFGDMTSDTNSYISLQGIYRAKAAADLEEVGTIYRSLFTTPVPALLENFCKNLLTLEVTRYKKISEELQSLNPSVFEDPDEIEYQIIDWYLALRSLDHFTSQQKALPTLSDLPTLSTYTETLGKPVENPILEESIRFLSTELHTVSALLGGVASQESVKLITNQYTPINNTFLFTGVSSNACVFQL